MPELPEVENVRRGLDKLVSKKTIQSIEVRVPKMVHHELSDFISKVTGNMIHSVSRRGKYLLFYLNQYVMISHLRMEGKYLLFRDTVPDNKHFHVYFRLTDGSTLVYQDVRKFGTFELCLKEHLEEFFHTKKLGPEPVLPDFKIEVFKHALKQSRKPIKSLLLEQKVVTGLGNIYVDEVLWVAKIHPKRLSCSLTSNEVEKLHSGIIRLLDFAIDKGGSSIRTYRNALGKNGEMQNYLNVYGKSGNSCPDCAHMIEKMKLGGRGTHFCPECQKC